MKVLALVGTLFLITAHAATNTSAVSNFLAASDADMPEPAAVDTKKTEPAALHTDKTEPTALDTNKAELAPLDADKTEPAALDTDTTVQKGSAPIVDVGMTTAAMEAALTDLMLGKTAFGATPMGGSVKKIEDLIVKTMQPKVLAAHRSDQRNLIKLANEIRKCGSIKDGALRKAAPPRNDYLRFSRLHRSCRSSEAVLYSSKVACLNQQRALYKEKVLRCNYFAQISKKYGTQKANVAIVKKAGSEKVEQYLIRISGTICGKHWHGSKGQITRKGGWGGGLPNGFLDQYLKAKERCERATRIYNAKVKECKRKIAAYQTKKGKCNQYQGLMDSNSCKHAVMVKDTCEAYAGCYFAKKKNYQIFQRKVITEETDRKAEWRGLKRMECLMKAFSDGKVTNAEVDACKKQTISTKLLNIKYPKIPPRAKCTIPNLYPATGAYKRREFKPLPTVAKGVACAPCSGIDTIPTTPRRGSPRGTKCARVALLGYYSPGALIKCTNGFDVRRSKDKNSCPHGTKIFSPATRSDWKTFLASTGSLRAPNWIIDVTRPYRGCGGCTGHPMNSKNKNQKTWRTSDGSPWWLRSTRFSEPNGDYSANCFLDLWHGKPRNENVVSFNDGSCSYHSKSYYCQPVNVGLKPKSGSPRSCQCSKVDLSGNYIAGALVKCEHCITVYRSSQKNSCPNGMKIFSPASRGDWKTFLTSAGPLRAPHWIVDVTRPQNGCGGCKKYAMKSSTPQQATWKTSDGSPWWLRSTVFSEPNGDYHANCFLYLYTPTSPDTLRFNDANCAYHSRSYYCQPTRRNVNYGGHHRRRREAPKKPRACTNIAGTYFPNKGKPVTLTQSGCSGRTAGGGWSFKVAGNKATIIGRGVTGTIKKSGGVTTITWSNGYIYTKGCVDISGTYTDNKGKPVTLKQSGCKGKTGGGGWTFTVIGYKATINGRGVSGRIVKTREMTKITWSNGFTYTRSEGAKPPVGIVQNYDQRKLFRAGWKVWKDVAYRHHTVRKDVQPTKGECILWGSKRNSGSNSLALAAFGRRKKIENKKRVWENGVYWYTQTLKNGNGSCGFSPDDKLSLNSADIRGGNLRLSWHLHTNMKVGGYRSGKKTGLNGDGNWRKVVMYGPCSGVKEDKKR